MTTSIRLRIGRNKHQRAGVVKANDASHRSTGASHFLTIRQLRPRGFESNDSRSGLPLKTGDPAGRPSGPSRPWPGCAEASVPRGIARNVATTRRPVKKIRCAPEALLRELREPAPKGFVATSRTGLAPGARALICLVPAARQGPARRYMRWPRGKVCRGQADLNWRSPRSSRMSRDWAKFGSCLRCLTANSLWLGPSLWELFSGWVFIKRRGSHYSYPKRSVRFNRGWACRRDCRSAPIESGSLLLSGSILLSQTPRLQPVVSWQNLVLFCHYHWRFHSYSVDPPVF